MKYVDSINNKYLALKMQYVCKWENCQIKYSIYT